jgi:uncharacterized protein YjbI with pentapeptide repeats
MGTPVFEPSLEDIEIRDEHLHILKKGKIAWNSWREENPNVQPLLFGLDFSGVDYGCYKFSKIITNWWSPRILDPNSEPINFEGAVLYGAKFINAKLSGANFENAALFNANFTNADLYEATFADDKTPMGWFKPGLDGCSFTGADLRNSFFCFYGISNVNFKNTHLQNVTFQGKFNNKNDVVLLSCDLEDADMDGSIGYMFSGCYVKGLRQSSNSKDKWSILSREYTGTRVLFNLIFLFLFLAPLLMKAMFWIYIADFQNTLKVYFSNIQPPTDNILSSFDKIFELKHVWEIILGIGGDDILLVILLFTLILFNLSKIICTFFISSMRDEEDRTGYTPNCYGEGVRGHYQWLYYVHLVNRSLFYLIVINAIISIYNFLNLQVYFIR